MKHLGLIVLIMFAGCTNKAQVAPPTSHVASSTLKETAKPKILSGNQLGEVRDVALSDDGNLLAIGTLTRNPKLTGYIQLRDGRTNALIKQWEVPNGVTSLAFSPDSTRLATGQYESLSVWQIPSGRLLHRREIDAGGGQYQVTCAFAPNGKTLAVGHGQLLVLDTVNWKPQHMPINVGEPGFVDSVKFSPDGRYLVTTHHDVGTGVELWDTRTGRNYPLSNGDGGLVIFSRDSRLMAVKNGRKTEIWQLKTKRPLAVINPNNGPRPLIFSPDNKKIICLDNHDSMPQIWDVRTGEHVKTSLAHDVLAISPDGKRVVTTDWGSVDGIKIENLDIKLF